MLPPVQVGVATVQVPPVPVTVKLPVVLVSEIPLAAPLDEMLVNDNVPPVPLRLTAVPVVVVTLTSPTVTPETPPPTKPVALPGLGVMLTPRTLLVPPTVTVFCTVGRVPLIEGRAMVPVGGLMPKTASKLAPVTPCPMSSSPVLSVIPVE